jgi:hypothetical protein
MVKRVRGETRMSEGVKIKRILSPELLNECKMQGMAMHYDYDREEEALIKPSRSTFSPGPHPHTHPLPHVTPSVPY